MDIYVNEVIINVIIIYKNGVYNYLYGIFNSHIWGMANSKFTALPLYKMTLLMESKAWQGALDSMGQVRISVFISELRASVYIRLSAKRQGRTISCFHVFPSKIKIQKYAVNACLTMHGAGLKLVI